MRRPGTLFLPFIFLFKYATAQNFPADSAIRQKSIEAVIDFYHQKQGPGSNLFNGPEVDPYALNFYQSTPYFKDSSFMRGTVFYDQVEYRNVSLRYDLVRDDLILLHFDTIHQISLLKEKVDWFYLSGHHFINLNPDTINTDLKEGYYDELFKGKVSLLMKRAKIAEEKIESGAVYLKISPKSSFYLLKDGTYFRIKNKNDLIRKLADKKAELTQYIRRNRLKFGKVPEVGMTSVVTHYNHLIK